MVLIAESPGHLLTMGPGLGLAAGTVLAPLLLAPGAALALALLLALAAFRLAATRPYSGELRVGPDGLRAAGIAGAAGLAPGSLLGGRFALVMFAAGSSGRRIALLRRSAQVAADWRRFCVLWHAASAVTLNKPATDW